MHVGLLTGKQNIIVGFFSMLFPYIKLTQSNILQDRRASKIQVRVSDMPTVWIVNTPTFSEFVK